MSRVIDLGKAHGPIPVNVAGVGSATTLYYGHASSGAPSYTIGNSQTTGSLTLDTADVGSSLAHFSPYADALGNTGTAILIPSTGTYRISATLPTITAASSTGSGNVELGVFVNGALRAIMSAGYFTTTTGVRLNMSGRVLLPLNGGQYVEVGIVNLGTSALYVTVNGASTPQAANLTVEKVGN